LRRRIERITALLALTAMTAVPAVEPAPDAMAERLQRELQRLQGEVELLRRQEQGVLGRLERLGAELRLRETRLREVTLRRDGLTAEIEGGRQDLARLEAAQRQRRAYLAFRVREVYKSGREGSVRRLLDGQRAQELLAALRYADLLGERDARALRALRETKDAIGEREARLAQEREAAEGVARELRAARAELERSRRGQSEMLESLRRDRDRRGAAIAELEQAAEELNRLVAGLAPAGGLPTLDVRKFRGLLAWPGEGEVGATFGWVVHPRFKTRVPHPGLDIEGEFGAGIRSVFDGKVVFAAWMRGYGLTAIVDHGSGLLSIYAHASALLVEPGQPVLRGERIATVGDTGSLRGPYLYFELRVDGEPTDPLAWLSPRDRATGRTE